MESDMEAIKTVKGVSLIFGDVHLCSGQTLPGTGGKPNIHELFKDDRAFVRMLRSFVRNNEGVKYKNLVLNGDIIDFHAIPYKGSFRCVPTEEAALAEFNECVKGHPRVFVSFRSFLRDPSHTIHYVIGNHDQELAWPSVQEKFRSVVDPHGHAKDRIHFVREVRIGKTVLARHGDQLEPMSTIPDEENMFITSKADIRPVVVSAILLLLTYTGLLAAFRSFMTRDFGFKEVALAFVGFFALLSILSWVVHKLWFWKWGREKRYLNVPTSTYMNSWLGQRLRKQMPWIGRMQNHGAIWFLALTRDRKVIIIAFPLLFFYFIYHRFFIEAFSHRRKFSLMETLKLLASTTHSDRPLDYLPEVANKYPKVRHFIFGHTHNRDKQIVTLGEREIVYWNAGPMIRQVRVVEPLVETSSSFPRAEAFFKRIWLNLNERPVAAVFWGIFFLASAVGVIWLTHYFGWQVSGYVIIAVAVLMLMTSLSYDKHRGEEFVEFTPIVVKEFYDDTVWVRLMHYQFEKGDVWVGYGED